MTITIDMIKKLRQLTSISIIKCKQALIDAKGDIELAIDNIRKAGLLINVKTFSNVPKEGIILVRVVKDIKCGFLLELNCETDFVARNNIFKDFANKIIDIAVVEHILNVDFLRNYFKDQCNMLINKFNENIKINRFTILKGNSLGCYSHGSRIGVIVDGSLITDELLKYIAMHIAANKPTYINVADIPKEVIISEHEIQRNIAIKLSNDSNIVDKIVNGRMQKFIDSVVLVQQLFVMDEKKTVGELLNLYGSTINNFVRFELGEVVK